MCLDYLTTEDPIIATEDIVAYKVALTYDGIPRAPYQMELYTINEPMYAALVVRYGSVHEGYHSLVHLKDTIDFHHHGYNRIYQCIIPKGTPYYEGKFGEWSSYAAETIIMKPLTLSQKVKFFMYKAKDILKKIWDNL